MRSLEGAVWSRLNVGSATSGQKENNTQWRSKIRLRQTKPTSFSCKTTKMPKMWLDLYSAVKRAAAVTHWVKKTKRTQPESKANIWRWHHHEQFRVLCAFYGRVGGAKREKLFIVLGHRWLSFDKWPLGGSKSPRINHSVAAHHRRRFPIFLIELFASHSTFWNTCEHTHAATRHIYTIKSKVGAAIAHFTLLIIFNQ